MENLVKKFSIFKGRRVLVTGDTGFKGSWLSLWLNMLGAEVYGFALPPKNENDLFNVLGLEKLIKHQEGDIRDITQLESYFRKVKPEFLFHLAAQPLVMFSYENPKLTFDTNIGGSVNILEVALNTPSLRSVIYVTSDKCYKNKETTRGYKEDDELGGHDPYSASKAAAELVFKAYIDSFFDKRDDIGLASARAGNVIGGGDWALDRLVPDNVKSLSMNQSITLRNPSATRPWQHVLEPLSGYLSLASNLYQSPKNYIGAWNFGPKEEAIHTVQDLTEKIISCWGSGTISSEAVNENNLHEAKLLHLNCDKALHQLDWGSRWGFDRTVSETIHWYKSVYENKSAIKISRQQIEDYTNTI